MMAMSRDRDPLTPALLGSAALHIGVAALFLISWPWARELKVGAVVPVKIVTNAPNTNVRPAIEAPEDQAAAVEEPVPDASLQAPTPPEPAPAPTPAPAPPPPPPPKPVPPKAVAPTPKPTPIVEKAPTKPQPAAKPAPRPEVDLDRLLASVSKGGRPAAPAQRSSAQRGPARAETAPQARPAIGAGISANALAGLSDELQRRWNPNCDVAGGRDVEVRVTFTLGASGQVVGEVNAGGKERSPNSVVQTAAERAIRAVYAAAPFRTLPREFYGDEIAVTFKAREACS